MNVALGYVTDRGLNPRRTKNEDSMLVLPEQGLFLVADGVGGRRGGETASRTVVDVFRRVFSQPRFIDDHRAVLLSTIDLCNQKIFEMAQSNTDLDGMATTVAAVAVNGKIATVVHVGDSRVYRVDSQGLVRLTEDHSEVNEALRAGRITEELAATHPKRNVISRALGADSEVEPDLIEIELDETTTLLLCTDGVTRHLDDSLLEDLLLSGRHPQTVCQLIRERCYDDGAEDNLTAVVIDFGDRGYDESRLPPPPSMSVVDVGSNQGETFEELWDEVEAGPISEPPSDPPHTRRRQANDRFEFTIPRGGTVAGPVGGEVGADAGRERALIDEEDLAASENPEETDRSQPGHSAGSAGRLAGLRWSLLFVGLAVGTVFGWLVGPPLATKFGELFGEQTIYDVKGIEQPPRDPEVNAAYALHLEQKSELARQRLEELVRVSPGNAEACLFLGIIEYDLDNFDQSVTLFQRAIKADPAMSNVRVRLALSFSRMGQSRNAADVLQEMVGRRNAPLPGATGPAGAATPATTPAVQGGQGEDLVPVKPVG